MRWRKRDTHELAPALWAVMACEYLGWSKAEAWSLWRVILDARYSIVVAFRQRLLFAPIAEVPHFQRMVSPAAMVELFEALVQERKLSRQEANRYAEAVLSRTTADGRWEAASMPSPGVFVSSRMDTYAEVDEHFDPTVDYGRKEPYALVSVYQYKTDHGGRNASALDVGQLPPRASACRAGESLGVPR